MHKPKAVKIDPIIIRIPGSRKIRRCILAPAAATAVVDVVTDVVDEVGAEAVIFVTMRTILEIKIQPQVIYTFPIRLRFFSL